MGVHQKIDRVARRRIAPHVPSGLAFPSTKEILHFEGLNGPDGIKRKSPAKDEPWHYIDPTRPNDTALLDMIDEHIRNLTHALDTGNMTRAAFEAAWMAHAITDGLTPPHHYPLAQKLEQLRALSNGEKILMLEVQSDSIGIDCEEDLQRARAKFGVEID